jgi:hypothetical protein
MWTHWQPKSIDRDLGRIAGLHANAVRVVLFPSLGYPHPSQGEKRELARFLRLAARHRLRVQLTLFGIWQEYRDLSGSRRWVQEILAPYRNDHRIAFVELQNEIPTANEDALAWARAIAPCVHALIGKIPLSLSVSGSEGVAGLERLRRARIPLDAYSFHYYGPAPLAYRVLAEARRVAGNTPLFIGETGYSTDPTSRQDLMPGDQLWWNAYQDQYLRTVAYAALALHLPVPAPWTYTDFSRGAFPLSSGAGQNAAEYQYGLVQADGNPKPAASTIRRMFSRPSVSLQFNNGFEQAGTSGLPLNWMIWEPQNGIFARDTQVAHSGQASVSISQSHAAPNGYPAFYLSPIQFIQPGRAYVASAWVRGQEATGVTHVALSWFDSSGKFLTTTASPDMQPGTTDWSQLAVTARAPDNAASVQLHLVSADNSGTAWFDDVTFGQAR